jgi:MarR-like DNA-binding transcriptional regulator SgrR of sgrS sRNA
MSAVYASPAHQIYPHGFVGALPVAREQELFDEIKKKADLKNLPKKLVGYGSVGGYLAGTPQWLEKLMKHAGVEVESHEMPYTDYQKAHKALDHDYVVVMTGMNSKDPAGSLLTLLSPKSGIIPDRDGVLNGLLQKAVEAEPANRPKILHEVSERLLSTGRIVPFVHHGISVVSSAQIEAHPPSRFDDELRLSDIRWKK